MLKNWIKLTPRDPATYHEFDVIDIEEISELSDATSSELAGIMQTEWFPPGFLESIAEDLGWESVKNEIIAGKIPLREKAQRGEFGEALLSATLKEFLGYSIPVPKLRFKFTSGQSLPSTDALALKLNDAGVIIEVCFIESKLRTTANSTAAIEGYNQLKFDYASRLPDILTFTAMRLYEQHHDLYIPFKSYMRDRRITTDRDSFRLGLCLDCSNWHEGILNNLQENGVDLPRLTVMATRIDGLANATDAFFLSLGITEVADEE